MGAEWEERGGGEGEGRPPHWSLARWRPMGRPRSALVTWRAHKSFAPLFSPPFSFFFFAFLLLFFFSLSLSLSLSGSSLSSGVSTDSSFVSPFVLFLLLFSFFRFFFGSSSPRCCCCCSPGCCWKFICCEESFKRSLFAFFLRFHIFSFFSLKSVCVCVCVCACRSYDFETHFPPFLTFDGVPQRERERERKREK